MSVGMLTSDHSAHDGCQACAAQNAVVMFAAARFAAFARAIVAMLQSVPAWQKNSAGSPLGTRWDDLCRWNHPECQDNAGDAAVLETLELLAMTQAAALPPEEARLLCIAIAPHRPEQREEHWADIDVEAIADRIQVEVFRLADLETHHHAPLPQGWHLREADVELLKGLRGALHSFRTEPRHAAGDHDDDEDDGLTAINEADQALREIIDGTLPQVNVELTMSRRVGSGHYEEAVHHSVRINEDEIRLDQTQSIWTRETGSDHATQVFAVLTPKGDFKKGGVAAWMDELSRLSSFDDAKITTSRDHL
jgi:hypothetical protein